MNAETKQLLNRWQALETGDGLRKAKSLARILWAVGLLLFALVVFGVVCNLHPALIAVAAAAAGWIIAERNALLSRATQWPVFRSYIDWKRVQEDLGTVPQ